MNCYSSLLKKQIKNPLRNQESPHICKENQAFSRSIDYKNKKAKTTTEDGTALEKAW